MCTSGVGIELTNLHENIFGEQPTTRIFNKAHGGCASYITKLTEENAQNETHVSELDKPRSRHTEHTVQYSTTATSTSTRTTLLIPVIVDDSLIVTETNRNSEMHQRVRQSMHWNRVHERCKSPRCKTQFTAVKSTAKLIASRNEWTPTILSATASPHAQLAAVAITRVQTTHCPRQCE